MYLFKIREETERHYYVPFQKGILTQLRGAKNARGDLRGKSQGHGGAAGLQSNRRRQQG